MSKAFRASFNSPQSGWMSLSLKAGEQSLVAAVSHAPDDSLRALIEALRAVLRESADTITVKWNCEPDELDFEFKSEADSADNRASLRVLHFPDHRRRKGTGRTLFSLVGPKLELCLPFWRALRSLHRDILTDEFERNWRRPFPEIEMQQLNEAVRAYRRKAKAQTLK
ncbi:MAG TPA: hypothetical protein VF544_14275 [Pyrinomonadaceae bacterium]|jgi:hypothetical protein